MGTLDFAPEASGEVESVGIISDGELSGVASGSSEKTDFVVCVEGGAVAEAGEGSISEDLQFLERHDLNTNSYDKSIKLPT